MSNIHESDGRSTRWAQIHFRLPGPDWNWSAGPVRPGTPLSSPSSPRLAAPVPSPLLRSLLCGIVCSNHLRLWHDSVLILWESIPICKLQIKQKGSWSGHWKSVILSAKDSFSSLGPLYGPPAFKSRREDTWFYVWKWCRFNGTTKSALTAGCQLTFSELCPPWMSRCSQHPPPTPVASQI